MSEQQIQSKRIKQLEKEDSKYNKLIKLLKEELKKKNILQK